MRFLILSILLLIHSCKKDDLTPIKPILQDSIVVKNIPDSLMLKLSTKKEKRKRDRKLRKIKNLYKIRNNNYMKIQKLKKSSNNSEKWTTVKNNTNTSGFIESDSFDYIVEYDTLTDFIEFKKTISPIHSCFYTTGIETVSKYLRVCNGSMFSVYPFTNDFIDSGILDTQQSTNAIHTSQLFQQYLIRK